MSEKQGKGRKRPKSYYLKCAHKKLKHGHCLETDMKGFLVTCNGNEKQAVREMYNLLNEYADKIYGPEKSTTADKEEADSEESDEEDVEAAMKKEVDAMKDVKPTERRFQNTNTKSRNTIFIKTTLDDPSSLAHTIMSDIYDNGVQKSRFAIRMLPIASTCKCRLDDIEACGKNLFKKYFETPFGTGFSYTTVYTKRNNSEISREAVIPKLGFIIKELNPLHRVNHTNPDYVILVEIIGNICCLSVVKDFFKFKKYNLIEVCKAKKAQENAEVAKTSTDENVGDSTEVAEDEVTSDENKILLDNEENSEDGPSPRKLRCEGSRPSDCDQDISSETEKKTQNEKQSLSRNNTVMMENVSKGDNSELLMRKQTVVMETLERNDTVVMESLARTETVVMQTLDRDESVMDALSKGETVMDTGVLQKDPSTMEVLTTGESVMESF